MSEPSPDLSRTVEAPYRSRGEVRLARMLEHYGISFTYEQPVAVLDQGKTRLWYPDFQLRDQGILIEYCGRTNDPAYSEGVDRKQLLYAANGLTAVMITPDIFHGPWPAVILGYLERIAIERLETIRAARRAHRSTSGSGFQYSGRE